MSLFGASRFTAVLAAIAICGTAGTFWWAIQIRADLKFGTSSGSANRALLSKSANRGLRPKDEGSNRYELMGRSERPQPGPPGWNEGREQLIERTAPPLVSVSYPSPGSQNAGADMPLPIPPARPDREPSPAKAPAPPAFALPLPLALPLPVENPRRQTREPATEPVAVAPSRPSKQPARSYYMEKIVEQGDAGELRYRYQRQSCEPPNMPDVCFMPQKSRRDIVVERK